MKTLHRVLIMAGGTGGHVFPALAVANKMQSQGIEIEWLGTQAGLEARVVPNAGIKLNFISISGVRGKGLKNLLFAPFRILIAVIQAVRVLRRFKPDIVIGMGGFVSGPGGIASCLLRYPLVIHEQNAKPGLTNRYLARVAAKILEGFPNTFKNNNRVVTVGNPVRNEMINLPTPKERLGSRQYPLRLLILGGSGGAYALNQLVPKALALMPKEQQPDIYHQTGEKHLDSTLSVYSTEKVQGKVVAFISEMDQAYSWADIVLCRSGALTVAELCAVGLGSVLVPFPFATDDHQTDNANFLVKNGAALLVQQNQLTAESLAELLMKLSASTEKRLSMANAAYQLRRVDAAEKVLTICEEICN